jgi:hypothetical protein
MSVHDAEPGDIYADKDGKLWRVVGVVRDPSVTVEEVEGSLCDPNNRNGIVSTRSEGPPRVASIEKRRQFGGVGGQMWNGFTRIFRPAST